MPELGVNIDHVATLRQARKTFEPEPLQAALICQAAGADGIVVHLREDRRHIQDKDLEAIRKAVRIKLNLEMAPTREMAEIACRVRPDQVTLVPERRQELTTEGGLDVCSKQNFLKEIIKRLQGEGLVVSLFIAPSAKEIQASSVVGAKVVELHTGDYANAKGKTADKELMRFKKALTLSQELGLISHAGHGLTYQNVVPIARLEGIGELNIGHTIISRAVLTGLDEAVREMLTLVKQPKQ